MDKKADLTEGANRKLSANSDSMASNTDGNPARAENNPDIDDQGTDQEEAVKILRSLRDNGFDGSDEKLGLALGSPIEHLQHLFSGEAIIDGDLLMKVRSIANERAVKLI